MIGEQQVIQSVRVTNLNDFNIVDRFDGVPYEFPANKSTVIPLDAAQHIFGWEPGIDQETLFRHTQRRFGWNTPAMMQTSADRTFFSRLEIEEVVYRLVEVRPEDMAKPELEGEINTETVDVKPPRGGKTKLTDEYDQRIARDRAG